MNEIDIQEFISIIKSKLRIILSAALLFAIVSGMVSYCLLKPQYSTFTTLMVGQPLGYGQQIQYTDILLNQKLVSTYGEIAKSRLVAQEVIDSMRLPLTYEELAQKISVNLIKETEIIKLNVTDSEPQMAAILSNKLAEVFMRHVSSIMKVDNIKVIDRAVPPIKPISPKPMLNISIACVLGLTFSTLFFLLKESFRKTIKTAEDLEKHLRLPLMGIIALNKSDNLYDGSIKNIRSEEFRMLRMNIQFAGIDNKIRSLVVTSIEPGEGKTTVVINLAYSLAFADLKVLVIDCDLRRPSIHDYTELNNEQGLTTVLLGGIDFRQAVNLKKDRPFDILTSGPIPPNPTELLGSKSMSRLLSEVQESYDMVLLDSPPAALVTDAPILSSVAGGVLIVCSAGNTEISKVRQIVALLEKANANILGVLLNKMKIKGKKYYSYYK